MQLRFSFPRSASTALSQEKNVGRGEPANPDICLTLTPAG